MSDLPRSGIAADPASGAATGKLAATMSTDAFFTRSRAGLLCFWPNGCVGAKHRGRWWFLVTFRRWSRSAVRRFVANANQFPRRCGGQSGQRAGTRTDWLPPNIRSQAAVTDGNGRTSRGQLLTMGANGVFGWAVPPLILLATGLLALQPTIRAWQKQRGISTCGFSPVSYRDVWRLFRRGDGHLDAGAVRPVCRRNTSMHTTP